MTTEQVDSSYFTSLFQTMSSYIDGSKEDNIISLNNNASMKEAPKLFNFTRNPSDMTSFINIAGNYKVSCVVPLEKNAPPNYIGMLSEQNALKNTFIDDLLSFTSNSITEKVKKKEMNPITGKEEEKEVDVKKRFNCTGSTSNMYRKLYRDEPDSSRTRGINFTQGMPYDIHLPAVQKIHAEICEKLNDIIDYIIATGQTVNNDNIYNNTLTEKMLRLFYNTKELPKYYDLRLGILPSAINFIKKDMNPEKIQGFMDDIDSIQAGRRFIPAGRSSQFLGDVSEDKHLYWYPFNTTDRYSYRFDDTATTVDTQRYIQHNGFNH